MVRAWLKASVDAAEHLYAIVERHLLAWRCLNRIRVRFVNAKDVMWKWYYFMEQINRHLGSTAHSLMLNGLDLLERAF